MNIKLSSDLLVVVWQGSNSQSVVPRPTASALFGKLFELQILKVQYQLTKSETMGFWLSYLWFNKTLRWFRVMLKFEICNHKLPISINLWRLWKIYIRMGGNLFTLTIMSYFHVHTESYSSIFMHWYFSHLINR